MKKLRGCKIGDKLSIFFLVVIFGMTKKSGVNHDVQSYSSLRNGWLLIAPSAALVVVACCPAIVNATTVIVGCCRYCYWCQSHCHTHPCCHRLQPGSYRQRRTG